MTEVHLFPVLIDLTIALRRESLWDFHELTSDKRHSHLIRYIYFYNSKNFFFFYFSYIKHNVNVPMNISHY